ncbi:MAG: hypothetical protein MHPSP_004086, partial [Paramarteilia canceri]
TFTLVNYESITPIERNSKLTILLKDIEKQAKSSNSHSSIKITSKSKNKSQIKSFKHYIETFKEFNRKIEDEKEVVRIKEKTEQLLKDSLVDFFPIAMHPIQEIESSKAEEIPIVRKGQLHTMKLSTKRKSTKASRTLFKVLSNKNNLPNLRLTLVRVSNDRNNKVYKIRPALLTTVGKAFPIELPLAEIEIIAFSSDRVEEN